jgi:hypothetical protein
MRSRTRGFAIGIAAGLGLVAAGVAIAAGGEDGSQDTVGDIQSVNSNVVHESAGTQVFLTATDYRVINDRVRPIFFVHTPKASKSLFYNYRVTSTRVYRRSDGHAVGRVRARYSTGHKRVRYQFSSTAIGKPGVIRWYAASIISPSGPTVDGTHSYLQSVDPVIH